MRELVLQLKQDYDYVVIDCPAGIEQGYKNAVAGADKALVVTTPEVSAVRDADRIIDMEQEDIESPKLVINRIRSHMMKNGDMLDVEEISQLLAVDLIGIVADDENVIGFNNGCQPIVTDRSKRQASIAYRNIAGRILGETVPLQSLDEEDKGMFAGIKRFFGVRLKSFR